MTLDNYDDTPTEPKGSQKIEGRTMGKKNLDRKNLAQPDAFEQGSLQAMEWVKKNAVLLSVLVLGSILITAGFFWNKYKNESENQSLRAELAKIDELSQKEADGIKDEREALIKQATDLSTKISKLKKDSPSSSEIATLEAQKKPVEEKIKNLLPDHTASLEKYLAFYNSHKQKAPGYLAGVHAAKIYVDQKKYDAAIPLLEHAVSKGSCLLYTSPSPRDKRQSRMPSSA